MRHFYIPGGPLVVGISKPARDTATARYVRYVRPGQACQSGHLQCARLVFRARADAHHRVNITGTVLAYPILEEETIHLLR